MRLFRFVCIATITALALFCSASVSAQSDPNFETGLKPFGSYDGGNIDSINLNNLSLSIALPLMSYPQTGGKLKLDFDFRINNFSYYYTVGYIDCPDGNGECGTTDWEEPGTIFGITQEGVPVYAASWTDNGTQYIGQAQITTPDQAVHQLGLTALSGGYWRSADATGYAIAGTYTGSVTGPIFDANGLRYSLSNNIIPNGAWYGTGVADANGNQISFQLIGQYPNTTAQWTDSVGRVIPAPVSTTNYSNCPNPSGTTSAKLWNLPGLNGGTYPLLFCYGGSVLTQYFYWQTCGCDGTQGELEQYSADGPMLQYIVLPNNTYWTFAYTSDGNANISQITFPTGGALCYTWHNVVGGNTNGPYYEMTSHVASRILDPSGTCSQSSPTWAYSQTFPSGNVITTVTDPAGNNTVHHFTFPTGVQTYYETETDYPAGKTVYYTYAPDNTCGATNGAILSTTKTMWSNGEENEIEYGYDSGFSAGQPFEWDSPPPYGVQMVSESCLYGLQASKQEYDYGSGAPGSLLRTTSTTYQYQNSANYLTVNLLNLPASVQVTGIGPGSYTTYGYDETGCSSGLCGNQTSVHDWLNTTGGYLVTTNTYDPNGRLTSVTDPNNNVPTTYGYSSSTCPNGWNGTYAGSGPTCITNPLNQTTYFNYDSNTGLETLVKDPNNLTTTTSYDGMLRTSEIDYPDTGQTAFNYSSPTEVDITELIDHAGGVRHSSLLVDGLGREITRATSNGDGGYDETDTCYDSLGRILFKSYPYKATSVGGARSCAEAGDTLAYDALSRTKSVTHSDDSAISTSYSGNSATVTDEQGKTRESFTDGLGRLSSVIEDPGGWNYQTVYSYDALDNLIGVIQAGSRQRTFVYDSVSRLTSATNPESGNTTYGYDSNGNLISKTQPAQNQIGSARVTISYCYDSLNRITSKAYTNQSCPMSSPLDTYTYDGQAPQPCSTGVQSYGLAIGQRTAMCDAAGSEAWTYGITPGIGDVTTDQRTTNGVTRTTVVQKNLAGSIYQLTYPSGRLITYGYDSGERATSAVDGSTSLAYVSNAHYGPDGKRCWAQYGGTITLASTVNGRLQPMGKQATAGTVAYPGSCSGLGSTGSLLDLTYGFNYGAGDNGNVTALTNNLHPTRSQNFSYDALNRLIAANTTSTYSTAPQDCWAENYQYDGQASGGGPWGNLTAIQPTGGAYGGCVQESGFFYGIDPTNRFNNTFSNTAFVYDSAGNMIQGPVSFYGYQYNAENQLNQESVFSTVGYVYDGDGKRVEKTSSGTAYQIYWYGPDGDVLDETDGTGNMTNTSFNEYVYFMGTRVAHIAFH